MNQTNNTFTKDSRVGQAVIIWPRGIRHQPVIYPLGSTEEETEAIRCLLKPIVKQKREIKDEPVK